MRKWHRWLSIFFGIFLFFIASTGLLSQAADLWPQPELTAAQLATQEPPAGFICPEGWNCRPPSTATGIASWKGFFHHIHSGEEFGPIGIAISILSGFALLFFSFSGLWMYIRMWSNRKERGTKGCVFWK